MLSRLKKCRDIVRLATANGLDVLDRTEYKKKPFLIFVKCMTLFYPVSDAMGRGEEGGELLGGQGAVFAGAEGFVQADGADGEAF